MFWLAKRARPLSIEARRVYFLLGDKHKGDLPSSRCGKNSRSFTKFTSKRQDSSAPFRDLFKKTVDYGFRICFA